MLKSYKCVVVANGLFPVGPQAMKLLNAAEFVIACDGAVVTLQQYRIPDRIVGDLDSLSEELKSRYADRLVQMQEQETNDLSKAMLFAQKAGFREVLILGATGLREDHTLGNISLLMEYLPHFDRVEMLSDFGIFTPIVHTTVFESFPGQQVSLFSLYPHAAISVSGLRYPIEKRRLFFWWEATLNEALGDNFTIIPDQDAQVLVYRQL